MNTEYGAVTEDRGYITITGTSNELYAWAHRPGVVWPCSELAGLDSVAVELDAQNGDLVDLIVNGLEGYDETAGDIDSNELTAWVDDCLVGTPFAHLQRFPGAVA